MLQVSFANWQASSVFARFAYGDLDTLLAPISLVASLGRGGMSVFF